MVIDSRVTITVQELSDLLDKVFEGLREKPKARRQDMKIVCTPDELEYTLRMLLETLRNSQHQVLD